MGRLTLAAVFALFVASTAEGEAPPAVAGLLPTQRPSAAPRVTRAAPPPEAVARARRGIDQAQRGFSFLSDQGAWYTPFDRPGMTGRYDLRRLHAPDGRGE